MALTAGTRLGPYEITAPLGAGGMGEVYRARDTKLQRDVAIKVLPDLFAGDAERLARFTREAQTLAALNHPNIAHIHGLEESDGVRALVMELVEGEDLAQRLTRGAMPLDEALPIAKQIAEALEAAHEQGIIHRDLKPANIKVRPDGTVKVLDFGLAKAIEGDVAGADLSHSPTLSVAATRMGVILGTAAYMSPEQARGKVVDRRTDMWAFGCVLYEMLTGTPAFRGDDVTEILAAVVMKEPALDALPASTPPAIRTLVRRCLRRDRRERLPDAGAARVEIQDALSAPTAVPPDTASAGRGMKKARLAWSIAAVAIVAAGALVFVSWQRAPEEAAAVRFVVSPPDGWNVAVAMTTLGAAQVPLAVAPNGRQLVLAAVSKDGTTQLWVRSLDALDSRALPGTDGAMSPFWSPDSRFVGFFADGKLKKIDVTGGPPVTLCDAPDGRGASWSRDDVILFSPSEGPLQKVSAAGGEPSAATVLGPGETRHNRPAFLPDGRHFFFYAVGGGIHLTSLDSPEQRSQPVSADSMPVVYSRGHLLFLREETLMAQPFDLAALAATGEAFPIAEQIQTTGGPNPYNGVFSASENGVLAYRTASAAGSELTWFDRAGTRLGGLGDPGAYGDVHLSPDGVQAAVSIPDQTGTSRDVWVFDVSRGIRTRLTSDPANETPSGWSPDGARVLFRSNRRGHYDYYVKASDGSGAEVVLLEDDLDKVGANWSADDRFLLYAATAPDNIPDLFALPLRGDRKPFPFLQTQFSEGQGRFSPDGRWVAYRSDESGSNEVYVTRFPAPGGKQQISTAGGDFPRWRRDGRELFYRALDGTFMGVDITIRGDSVEVGTVNPLVRGVISVGTGAPYDVSADGKRFLLNTRRDQTSEAPITVVLNWTAGLTR